MIKEKAKATARVNPELEYAWTVCFLSHTKLREPIVSDYKGHLFNKEEVLEYLLDTKKSTATTTKASTILIPHVKSLKRDLVELHFTTNDDGAWICPITKNEIMENLKNTRYFYLAGCGHVFSERGARAVKMKESCFSCDMPFTDATARVYINTDSDADGTAANDRRLQELKNENLSHSLASIKKKKRSHKQGDMEETTETKKRRKLFT